MDITKVWEEIRKMEGSDLRAIKKGSITVLEVTDTHVEVKSEGVRKSISWTYNKIKLLVDALSTGLPIHVESVLEGGGSRRKVPETLLANLPDVEWLFINGKKHIVWVRDRTHSIGTTKKVDSDRIEGLKKKLAQAKANQRGYTVVFCSDLTVGTAFYEKLLNTIPIQATTHSRIQNNGAVVILRLTPKGFKDGQSFPVMIVENVNEFVEEAKKGTKSSLKFTPLPSDLSLPNQVVIEDNKGNTFMVSERFE